MSSIYSLVINRVTYDPAFSLVDPSKPYDLDAVQIIAQVACHETAHHWHGNLITMKWWNEMYINEGYARWLQYTCNKALIPEWDFFNAGIYLTFTPFLI
jgi:aminopeptidase N